MAGYNFTDHMRRTLKAALEASEELRSGYVGPEHLLVAVLRFADAESRSALQAINVDPGLLFEQFAATLRPGNEAARGPDTPYTAPGKRVLKSAMAEAEELQHSYVGTEHLLLGLTNTPSPAATFLQQHGVDHARLRAAIRQAASQAIGPTLDPVYAGPWTTASTARAALIVAVGAFAIALMALMLALKAK